MFLSFPSAHQILLCPFCTRWDSNVFALRTPLLAPKQAPKETPMNDQRSEKKLVTAFSMDGFVGWVLDIFHTVLLLKNQVQVLNRAEMWNIPRQSRQRERNLGQLSF